MGKIKNARAIPLDAIYRNLIDKFFGNGTHQLIDDELHRRGSQTVYLAQTHAQGDWEVASHVWSSVRHQVIRITPFHTIVWVKNKGMQQAHAPSSGGGTPRRWEEYCLLALHISPGQCAIL